MTECVYKINKIIWQTEDKHNITELPIILEYYIDSIIISQNDNRIILSYESVNKLIKALKYKPE